MFCCYTNLNEVLKVDIVNTEEITVVKNTEERIIHRKVFFAHSLRVLEPVKIEKKIGPFLTVCFEPRGNSSGSNKSICIVIEL